MALTDTDVQKQIRHMVAFIEQEALEKIEEIEARTEEEYMAEKDRLVKTECDQIAEVYDRKELEFNIYMRVIVSQMQNQARMCLLRVRDDHVYRVLEEANRRLGNITNDKAKYKDILSKMILQALYQAMESEVILQCREVDRGIIDELLPGVISQYESNANQKLDLTVDDTYLPAEVSGGIVLEAMDGCIIVTNTLDSRLKIISDKLLPQIRAALFGENPNRKFTE